MSTPVDKEGPLDDRELFDAVALYKAVSKTSTARLISELSAYQNKWTEAEVKLMSRSEIVHYTMSLRKSAGQSGSVKKFVEDFKPTPFSADAYLKVSESCPSEGASGESTPKTDAVSSKSVKDPMASFGEMMMMIEQKRIESEERCRREASMLEHRRYEQLEQERKERRESEETRWKLEEQRQISLQESLLEIRQTEQRRATRSQELSQQRGNRLKVASDMTRGAIYSMPSVAYDIPPYFTQMDRIFDACDVDDDLRVTLLTPYLTEKARTATLTMTAEQLNDYTNWKSVILREFHLTSSAYRQQFIQMTRNVGESCNQFVTRLTATLNYYLASRKVSTYKELVELLLCDRLRDSLHPTSRHYIQDREQAEWMKAPEMSEVVDLFEVSRGYNQKDYDYNRDKPVSVKAVNIEPNSNYVAKSSNDTIDHKSGEGNNQPDGYTSLTGSWRSRISCFHCHQDGHLKKNCPNKQYSSSPVMQQNTGDGRYKQLKPWCWICKNNQHWTQECSSRPRGSAPESCWYCGEIGHKMRLCPSNRNSSSDSTKLVRRVDVHDDRSNYVEESIGNASGKQVLCNELGHLKGFVNLGGKISPFMCDSGTEISVISYDMLPRGFLENESSGRYINLQSAWGDLAKAQLVNVPAKIVQNENETVGSRNSMNSVDVLLCCAVTDRLHRNTALLTLDDVKTLQQSLRNCIPEVELITGTHIRYTDPHCVGDQTVRRVEEVIANRNASGDLGDSAIFDPLKFSVIKNMDDKTVEQFRKSQLEDISLELLWGQAKEKNSLFTIRDDDQLLYRKKDLQGTVIMQLVLPKEYREQITFAAHDTLWSMHSGNKKTCKRIELYFWWPGISAQVEKYVKSCKECQSIARKTKLDRVPITPVERGLQAFDIVHIDLIGPLPVKSSRGHLYVLCGICSLTRWPMAVPLKSLSAKELCDALLTLFSTCGIPRVIVSDNGTNMVSGLTKEVYKRFGIELRTSTPYHPEGNGMVERFNQSLKKMLHHIVTSEDAKNWDKKLPFLLWSYRELPNATTKISPHMMVFGQTPKGPLSVLRDHWSGKYPSEKELPVKVQAYLNILQKDLEQCREAAAENAKETELAYRKQYNVSAKEKSFVVGDLVLILMPDNSHKLLSKWMGPGTVTAVLSENTYRVALDSGAVKQLHSNHLRKFIPRVNSLGVVFEEDGDFGHIELYPSETSTSTEFEDQLDKCDLNHLDTDQQRELRAVLTRHKKIFSTKPGHCKVVEHEINLVEGFVPKPRKQYRIPDKLKSDVENQIDKLLEDGKVRHSTSEYAHPIIAVNKPDGSVRLCTDLRMVNTGTVNCAYPSVISDDILIQVSKSRFITTLDCTSGYWQIPMRESDIHKTAFHSSRGLLEWVYMPFGLKTASATFQRAMDIILRPYSEYAAAYIDDVITYSGEWTDHLKYLEDVLTAIEEAGMTLKLSKCQFAKPKVKFIGHIVGSGERSVIDTKVEAILSIPEPVNKKSLRSFLGMCSFYRSYIPKFAEIAVPLTDMTKKRKSDKLKFDTLQREAFNQLKHELSNVTTLYSPDSSRPFIVRTDASDLAVGAVLAQEDDEGREFPISFASSKLNGAQLNWSTIEKEAYAILYAMEKFDYMIFGRHIKLYTDHNPLQYLIVSAPKSAKLTRWALSLSRYDLEIFHTAGVDNVTADCLSRVV